MLKVASLSSSSNPISLLSPLPPLPSPSQHLSKGLPYLAITLQAWLQLPKPLGVCLNKCV